MSPTLLFLCTGNYYRSRLSELYFRHHFSLLGIDWQLDSCGLAIDGRNPGPISRDTVRWLSAMQIPLPSEHRWPRDLTTRDLEQATRVIAMKEAEHRPLMRLRFPDFEHKVEYWHIDDQDVATPAEALPLLVARLDALLQEFASAKQNPHD